MHFDLPIHLPVMPLRLRLTLWYSGVLGMVLIVFGIIVYYILSVSLTWQIDQSIDTAATRVIEGSSVLSEIESNITIIMPRFEQIGDDNIYLQFWKPTRQLGRQSDNLGFLLEPLDAPALQAGVKVKNDVRIQGVRMRVSTIPLVTPDGREIGFLQVAASMRALDIAQSALLLVLVSGGFLAVILATIIGWLSAGRALRPLNLITQTATRLSRANDLSRRIPTEGMPPDEVGRLATAFNESLERLERLFNTQRRFLADVSHELRTPLTAIRGNVDLMRRIGPDDASLDAIQSEAERMNRLVGDLLVLAQADSGHLPLAQARVELDTLLFEVLRELRGIVGGVQLAIGEIDQIAVLGDRDRLKQVLINLVSNALKYTGEGGRVTLGLCRVNDWARLTVTDTGIGIPPDELPMIFDRFYRVDKARARTEKSGGAGLGLSIAQRIIQMHGGRIEAASEGIPGKGATFSVWLPLEKKPEPAKESDKPKRRTLPLNFGPVKQESLKR